MVWYMYGIVCHGMVWHGMAWHGMVWYGTVRYGMVWYGMVWYEYNGIVWYLRYDMDSVVSKFQTFERKKAR